MYTMPSENDHVKTIDFSKELFIDDFSGEFEYVANVFLDSSSERKTVIRFESVVSKDKWMKKNRILYIFTMNDRVVKIGETRSSLKNRCASYLCGHHTMHRGKSGKCSETNAYIYNTFEYYLLNGVEIKMYSLLIPDDTTNHEFEGKYIQRYKSMTTHLPLLCNNFYK